MIKYLFRGIALAIGLYVAGDVVLPVSDHSVQVGRLSEPSHGSYLVQFSGARQTAFDINKNTYEALRVGDKVVLGLSRTFWQCVYIKKDGVDIYSKGDWRFWEGVIALLLFVIAFGGASNNSDRVGDDDWGFDFSDD